MIIACKHKNMIIGSLLQSPTREKRGHNVLTGTLLIRIRLRVLL